MDAAMNTRLFQLSAIAGWMYLSCIINSIICIVTGCYVQYKRWNKTNLLPSLGELKFSLKLIIVGSLGFTSHLHISWMTRSIVLLQTRRGWKVLFFLTTVFVLLIISSEVYAGCMALDASKDVAEFVEDELLASMKVYRDDVAVKQEMDTMQTENECCGSASFADWFETGWIHPDFVAVVDMKTSKISSKGQLDAVPEEVYYGKLDKTLPNGDVPYSCCAPNVLRPCVHERVLMNELHFNYNFNVSQTIYTDGCAANIIQQFEGLLRLCGIIVIVVACLKLIPLSITCYYYTFIRDCLVETADKDSDRNWTANCISNLYILCPSIMRRLAPRSSTDRSNTEDFETDSTIGTETLEFHRSLLNATSTSGLIDHLSASDTTGPISTDEDSRRPLLDRKSKCGRGGGELDLNLDSQNKVLLNMKR